MNQQQGKVQVPCQNPFENAALFNFRLPPRGACQRELSPEVEIVSRASDSTGRPADGWGSEEESEEVLLCPHCHLPLGDLAYCADDEEGPLMHGECKAQLILQEVREEEKKRLQEDASLKEQRRAKYDLGWKVERIPRNAEPVEKLGCGPFPHGMCALVWTEDSRSIQVVPTLDQAACVNLEYLSLALRVRKEEGREPMFSLDPKTDSTDAKEDFHKLWQVKRFEPEWLSGTSAGEVMFQADLHLKELSMGEYDQPVTGMRSCFDFSADEGLDKEWCAREWFVVNKAEVHLAEDNVMIPHVKMGVEARETSQGSKGLEDVPITRPNHPLVKYADAFTHFFDLIAERKSVVFHLRELAKASVLAKFLVENGLELDESWYKLAGTTCPTSCPEIPQLWNELCYSRIRVSDGRIVESDGCINTQLHGVYGGVEMGLERLGRVPAGRARLAATGVQAARAPSSLSARMIAARGHVAEFPYGAAGVAAVRGGPAAGIAAVRGGMPAVRGGMPKGVDLNLDKFSLAEPIEVAERVPEGSWGGEEFLGGAFWSSAAGPAVKDEHKELLRSVFHPLLCDRRDEGDLFVPPDTSSTYVSTLRDLVKEEAEARQERKAHFLSPDFDMANAGPLFPSSWAPWMGVSSGRDPPASFNKAPQGLLYARPECQEAAAKALKSAVPIFDKKTEDGMRFRVYKVGSLEVRTTQALEGEEAVGAVFSSRPPTRTSATEACWSTIAKNDRIVKVVVYVEESLHNVAGAAQEDDVICFFAVLETDQGDMIVTEKVEDYEVTWVENPTDLEYRTSLAKAICSADCRKAGITVKDMKSHQSGEASRVSTASPDDRRRYAHSMLLRVLPAREKAWEALTETEVQAAEELGICSAEGWDERSAAVWRLAWHDLSEMQRLAACDLGFSRALWGNTGRSLGGTWGKNWAQLTEEERRAARTLGFADGHAWDEASWDQLCQESGSVWEKSWAQLAEAERQAAKVLGVSGADDWDSTSWRPGGAWQEPWAHLTSAERQAARQLGIRGANMWDQAFGGAGRKGKGLGGVWEKSWSKLTKQEREAAKQLGITGAGAWDRSEAKVSAEKKWAQLTDAEKEARMGDWYKKHGGGFAGACGFPG